MQSRRGISPFIATVILVAITLALGGVLYTQFRQVVTAEVRNPSMSLLDSSVGGDGQTLVVDVKNDGNVQLILSEALFQYQSSSERFMLGSNASVIAGSATMEPGDVVSLKFTVVGATLPNFSTYTLTLVSDQLARAFALQAQCGRPGGSRGLLRLDHRRSHPGTLLHRLFSGQISGRGSTCLLLH